MGSAGPWSQFVGGGGGRSLPFVVVGTWHVFIILVYHWSMASWQMHTPSMVFGVLLRCSRVITHLDTHIALCLYILSSIPPFCLCLHDLCVSSTLSIIRGHSTCLGHSFPSVAWPLMGGGGVTSRVLTANHQWVVDGGGAVLVGWVVIDMVGLLTYPL